MKKPLALLFEGRRSGRQIDRQEDLVAKIIDLRPYIEKALKRVSPAAGEKDFSTWAMAHFDEVTKKFGCNPMPPEAEKGFRAGVQWAFDLQDIQSTWARERPGPSGRS
jgi:hypothetical protein